MSDKLILIVEDNKLNSQLISDSLDRMGYSDNHIVDNYKSAIEFVDKTPPDLILMDIMLKRSKDGVTIAHKIQTKHDIPIIYISGYARDEIIKRVKNTNPYSFIKKPFKYDDLKANVEIAFSKHKSLKKQDREKLKYEQAFINMHCGVITTDAEGSVLFLNKVAEILTGFTSDEAQNKQFEKVFNIDNRYYNSRRLIDETTREGTVHKLKPNLKIKSKNGSKIAVEIKTSIGTEGFNKLITVFFWEKTNNNNSDLLADQSVVSDYSGEDKINLMLIANNSLLSKGILNILDTEESIDICFDTPTKLEILQCSSSEKIDFAIVLEESPSQDDIYETIELLKNEIPRIRTLVLHAGLDDEKELKLLEHGVNGVISYKKQNLNLPYSVHSMMKGDLW